ncbi:hypothetical protein AK830_g4264 [Neonectria ditissima]|uniref:Uncharacterized protein n=1 Tax=Neonectria ditissima TaxID=78410 RepID=A0A0N8H7N6_9HYPO|nr:hypothetical protein AK830_g4264 [Neonectria ditissima]
MIWDPKDDSKRDYDGVRQEADDLSQEQATIDAFATEPIVVFSPKIYKEDESQDYISEGPVTVSAVSGVAVWSSQRSHDEGTTAVIDEKPEA